MLQVVMYSKEQCPLCDKGEQMLQELKEELPFELSVVDIYKDDELLLNYQLMIPVAAVQTEEGIEEIDYGQLSKEKIRKRLLQIIG
ncbi:MULTISPECIES: glutaredoxin family protein [Alkalihalophilus]|uniref:Glutaredoxin n=1 Tax=Alkalihalophilus pseudofirmus (strain ATCC BAA-2126 / JCM 17055 / OF4) TaxID=398511 RepID=D3FY99_ALKPO|nr:MULTISPECIES: glutaredoxin family protein [Alkalihalophilus]ADC49122.1 hypothetical protein BpOF4_05300 [Alkalihalophilus pseudofirmus OF4]MEC2071203.1 glutaredoxin family protein [Alkalihalophilus marmarensis]